MPHPRATLPILALALLAACAREGAVPPPPWERVDLWSTKPVVETPPPGSRWLRASTQTISFLGTAEVRDMAKIPPSQLVAFPRRTAGQVRAVAQTAGSRLRWRVVLGTEPYLSFVPLGTEAGCACTYRVTVRAVAGGERAGAERELWRRPVTPVEPIAPAAVELPLAPWANRPVDLLFEVRPLGPLPDAAAGAPPPAALWGSPAVYGRKALPPPPAPGAPRQINPAAPNVLVLGLDTVRADALGPWRQGTSLTPAMDRLAAESDVWMDAFTAFNVTNPSFASIFTGLYGKDHGVYDLSTPLPRAHTTLAELFRRRGYETLAVISARHLGDHNSGLGQGFADVTLAGEHFAAELAVDMAMDWIASPERAQRRWLAWVHLFDPHTPHTPPRPYALGSRPSAAYGLAPVAAWVPFRPLGPRAFDEPVLGGHRDLYAGEVAYLDRQVGRLLDFLASRGLLETTVVALVSDHGEQLGEHGVLYRHVGLHDTTTHVPLMVRWPASAGPTAGAPPPRGRRLRGLVQTIDLFPTLLAAAGLPPPPQDGEDLRALTAPGRHGRRAVFAEHAARLGVMVRTPERKLILSRGNTRFFPDGPALYDLRADPGEERSLAGRGLPAERELGEILRRWLAARRPPVGRAEPRPLSDEERRRLEALGYLR
ncbi:MAG TPA: sulfatase [Thermoanaerobaculia bacterium]|nr:sulfatase [Thermoanaerobaculia bacterium]